MKNVQRLIIVGTGKSFIGALLAKILTDHTSEKILVICYTNHALDQFLEDLMDIGISGDSMVRLGAKSTPRTKPLNISEQRSNYRRSQASWEIIKQLKSEAESYQELLVRKIAAYRTLSIRYNEILEHLEFSEDETDFYSAFSVPVQDDGMTRVGRQGKAITPTYLLDRWVMGQNAGIYENSVAREYPDIWRMNLASRHSCITRWQLELFGEIVSEVHHVMQQYNRCQERLGELYGEKNADIIKNKRVIGCTTTGAAKYAADLQNASPGVILVEEAGEILESHILTAMTQNTKQLILIGDHKQLRPKVNNYALTVEKGDGYNLNQSLFERLVLAGVPHTTLSLQHRMSPEISSLIRHLTDPELRDAPKTQNRPAPRGFQDRVMFITHDNPELEAARLIERRDEGSTSSKENLFEVEMVLKCVRYLAQQGYGTDELIVLTPYLGQLQLLRTRLSVENDPVLNDLDSYDLVRAGLVSSANAGISKRPIRISTIGDNFLFGSTYP